MNVSGYLKIALWLLAACCIVASLGFAFEALMPVASQLHETAQGYCLQTSDQPNQSPAQLSTGHLSLLPLSVVCSYLAPSGSTMILVYPPWNSTINAGVGLILCLSSILFLWSSNRTRNHPPKQSIKEMPL